MRGLAIALTVLAAVAIVAIAAGVLLAGGARVTVISISDVDASALETVKEIFPVEEGVYCSFEGCCKREGGVASLDLRSGAVICASGAVSHCRCMRQDLFIRRLRERAGEGLPDGAPADAPRDAPGRARGGTR